MEWYPFSFAQMQCHIGLLFNNNQYVLNQNWDEKSVVCFGDVEAMDNIYLI